MLTGGAGGASGGEGFNLGKLLNGKKSMLPLLICNLQILNFFLI